jgi:hypothetical protein
MSEIRALRESDIPAIAGLFQRMLRKSRQPASSSLVAYLETLFLMGPDQDPEIVSHVHVRDGGAISGFVGVLPLPLTSGERPLRGAICGTLMVDGHEQDPFAGARLMRAFLAGPQDISLTETANDVSTAMWRNLRGTVLPDYSLEWLRIIRPAGLFVEMATSATSAARILAPFAKLLDAFTRRKASEEPRWISVPLGEPAAKVLKTTEADDEATIKLFGELTSAFAIRPQWRPDSLRRMVSESYRKANYGEMVRRTVTTRDGRSVGLFLYYGNPGRIGRVVQILAAPGQAGAVIDSMVRHAAESGIVALRGRTQPALLEAMLGRRFAFVHASSSIVHARDPALVEPFRSGGAFFNGFAGESWSRLIGDRFD